MVKSMQYENVEKLNRQGGLFVAIHTLFIVMLALDFSLFA